MLHAFVKSGTALALSALALGGCALGSYGYGVGSTWASNSYDGWYDGHYGSIYDGYWGTDDNFYYRRNEQDNYRRGDRTHFQRGQTAPDPQYQRLEGQTRQPRPGMRMPRYPGQDNGRRNRAHGRGSDGGHIDNSRNDHN